MDLNLQNTILLKHNVAIARNYMILPWYLKQFAELENINGSRQDPNVLNLILKQANRRLTIKAQEIE